MCSLEFLFCNSWVVILERFKKGHPVGSPMDSIRAVVLSFVAILGVAALVLMGSCALELSETDRGAASMPVFDSSSASDTKEDLYQKWVEYDRRRAEQDKWDEFAQTARHELTIDADLSDEWIDCDRDVTVDVSIENAGDVAEPEAFVLLDNDKLGIHSKKAVEELEPGHFAIVRFPLFLDNKAPGDYEFVVQLFREEDELEGTDSVELKVRDC